MSHRAATRIINAVRGINRIVYDITSKLPGTIEWEGGNRSFRYEITSILAVAAA